MSKRVGLIAMFLFGSGFAALVYQTVWQKLFLFVFGATSDASAAVLGIFLGGLGVGSAVLGKKAEAHKKPLRLYGMLELGIGIWAGLSPFLIDGATFLYGLLGGSQVLGRPLAIVVRLALATIAIGPAAFFMGGTLPAAARAAVASDDRHRTGLARLYALNTLGAVFGALCGPLFFFGTFGIQKTLYAAVLLNLAVAFSAAYLGKTHPLTAPERAPAASDETEQLLAPFWVYVLSSVVGFSFLYMELVWFRMLAPLLGGSAITFGLILAVALAGIGVGGFWYSVSCTDPNKQVGLPLLIGTLTWEALFLLIPFAWGDGLALLTAQLRMVDALGYHAIVAGWVVIAGIVVFPAAVTSGYQFPILFALLGRGRKGVAQQVGRAYAFNTIGTITGSLIGGFLLIPWLGAVGSWRLAAGLLLSAAGLLLTLFYRSYESKKQLILPCTSWIFACVLLCTNGPGHIWRHTPTGAGRVSVGRGSPNDLRAALNGRRREIFWESDGREVAVAVSTSNGVAFLVNGKSDGAVVGDRGTQIMLGLVPAGLHPAPRRAFVVGLGTGTTAGMLGLVKSMERVDVAELEPDIVRVAELSELANGEALENQKVRVILGDAREVILSRELKYDLIVSEPSNPYRMGVANLFTREFYQLVASRLDEGGIFGQWIQGYEIDAHTLSSAIATLKTQFPYVSIWNSAGTDFILIATRKPQTVRLDALEKRLAEEPFRSWFPRSKFVEGAEAFAAQQFIQAGAIHLLTNAVPGDVNTDDLNHMEHSFARNLGMDAELNGQLHDLIVGRGLVPDTTPVLSQTALQKIRPRLNPMIPWKASARSLAIAMGCAGKMTEAKKHWPQDAEPQDVVERWVVGYLRAAEGDGSGGKVQADALRARGFSAEARLIEARGEFAAQDPRSASRSLVQTFDILRREALPLCEVPEQTLGLSVEIARVAPSQAGRLYDALAKAPFGVFTAEAARERTLIELSKSASPTGELDTVRCTKAYKRLEPHALWEERHLKQRLLCYEATSHPLAAAAARDLRAFFENEPERYLPARPVGAGQASSP